MTRRAPVTREQWVEVARLLKEAQANLWRAVNLVSTVKNQDQIMAAHRKIDWLQCRLEHQASIDYPSGEGWGKVFFMSAEEFKAIEEEGV